VHGPDIAFRMLTYHVDVLTTILSHASYKHTYVSKQTRINSGEEHVLHGVLLASNIKSIMLASHIKRLIIA